MSTLGRRVGHCEIYIFLDENGVLKGFENDIVGSTRLRVGLVKVF